MCVRELELERDSVEYVRACVCVCVCVCECVCVYVCVCVCFVAFLTLFHVSAAPHSSVNARNADLKGKYQTPYLYTNYLLKISIKGYLLANITLTAE
jgi:hypothetical protein